VFEDRNSLVAALSLLCLVSNARTRRSATTVAVREFPSEPRPSRLRFTSGIYFGFFCELRDFPGV
jgi:hypothetical protein